MNNLLETINNIINSLVRGTESLEGTFLFKEQPIEVIIIIFCFILAFILTIILLWSLIKKGIKGYLDRKHEKERNGRPKLSKQTNDLIKLANLTFKSPEDKKPIKAILVKESSENGLTKSMEGHIILKLHDSFIHFSNSASITLSGNPSEYYIIENFLDQYTKGKALKWGFVSAQAITRLCGRFDVIIDGRYPRLDQKEDLAYFLIRISKEVDREVINNYEYILLEMGSHVSKNQEFVHRRYGDQITGEEIVAQVEKLFQREPDRVVLNGNTMK